MRLRPRATPNEQTEELREGGKEGGKVPAVPLSGLQGTTSWVRGKADTKL